MKNGPPRAIDIDQQDSLTGFTTHSRNRSSVYYSQERKSKTPKFYQLTPAKVSKQLDPEYKFLVDSQRDPKKSLHNLQKNLKISYSHTPNNSFRRKEDTSDSPFKRNSDFLIHQGGSPHPREGRNSSVPKYSKAFIDKHQTQATVDLLSCSNNFTRQTNYTKSHHHSSLKLLEDSIPEDSSFNHVNHLLKNALKQ